MTQKQKNIDEGEIKYKLIVIGDENIGKTSIIERFKNNQFSPIYEPTLGMDFQSIPILIDDQSVTLLLYDTAGSEKYRSLISLYSNEANIVFLTYDISNLESFNNIGKWYDSLSNINKDEVIFALVGNKLDLDYNRKVKKEDAEKYANEHNYIFQEVSALNGDGIQELFMNKLIDQIRTQFIQRGKNLTDQEEATLKININSNNKDNDNDKTKDKKNKNKKCCCINLLNMIFN
jgi:small GTP-binding protein